MPKLAAQVRGEQLRKFADAAPVAMAVALVNAAVLGWVQWPVVDHRVIVGWLGVVAASVAGRILLIRVAGADGTEAGRARLGRMLGGGLLAAGAVWGAGALLLFPPGDVVHQVFLAFILAGMNAGAVATLPFLLRPVQGFLLLSLIPLTARLLLADTPVSVPMGAMVLLFLTVLLFSVRRVHTAVLQNIALRIEAGTREADLEDTQARYRSVVEASPLGMCIHELRGGRLTLTHSNPAASRILGTDCRRFRGLTVEEAFPPLEATEVPARCREIAAHGGAWSGEAVALEHGGVRGTFEMHAFQVGPGRVALTFRDVTDRRRAEQALADSERRFRALVENAGDGFFLHDREGRFLDVNRRACESLGYTRTELLDRRVFDVEQGVTPEGLRTMWDALEPEAPLRVEGRHARKDGTTFPVEVVMVRLTLGGEPRVLALARDITERKRFEAELVAARDEAQAANAAKTQFLSRMTHELRTPLNGILGFAHLLDLERDHLSPEQRESVSHVLAGGRHLLALIEDLLDLSRLEQGRLRLHIEPVGLEEVLDGSVKLVAPLAEHGGVRIEGDWRGAPVVAADPARLKQVFLNLLSNAVKYNVAGGRVTIEADCGEGGRARVAVADTGRGIGPDLLPHVFEPFRRAPGVEGMVEGTGIGLSIARHLVELMGGEIGVSSEPGQGTRFWVELPLAARPARGSHRAARAK